MLEWGNGSDKRKPRRELSRIANLVRLTVLLQERHRGMRATDLASRLGVSLATLNRYLATLREAGMPLHKEPGVGEVRHVLLGKPLPPLQPTPSQLKALRLARRALAHLAGTTTLAEIDALLAPYPPTEQLTLPITLPEKSGNAPLLRVLEDAIAHGRQVMVEYRAAAHGGKQKEYRLDPLFLCQAGADLYLGAFDHAAQAPRRFKLARIQNAHFLEEHATAHPDLTPQNLFTGAVKAWGGDPLCEVVVRLSAAVAWKVREYPILAGQAVEPQPNGSVLVRAQVAGLTEVQQWVLGWGAEAEALEPKALRDAVRAELRRASAAYDRPGLAAIKRGAEPRKAPPTAGESRGARGNAQAR